MSDLFKDHKPELSEEEDRLLWQRVRAIPALETAPALRPAPWWRKLWEMPGVRYGAPALAVLVAAVVWVTQREPEYQPRSVRHEASSPTQTAPPVTGSVPTRNSARVTAVDEKVATKPDVPTKDKAEGAEWRADEVAPSENQREEVAAQSAPNTAALRKSAPAAAPTFAPPPSEVETRERKQVESPAPQAATVKAADSKVAGRAVDQPQWGAVKNGYRDSGNSAQLEMLQVLSVPDQLVHGTLPAPAQLADHPLLKAVSNVPYLTALRVPPPMDMRDEFISDFVRQNVRVGSIGFVETDVPVQAAVIALALERALAAPASVPRTRIEAMLAHAREVDASANAVEKPGTTKLVAMIEGALKAWP